MRIIGTATLLSGTGIKSVTLGFQPTWIRVIVCEKSSGDTVAHQSYGMGESSTYQYVRSTFSDPTSSNSFNDNTKIIAHYERVSGVITKVFSASLHAFTATGVQFNVDIANTGYQLLIEAGN